MSLEVTKVEVTKKDLPATPTPSMRGKAEFDWTSVRRRLDASRDALKRKLDPGAEEKKTILRARARSLAGNSEAKANARPHQFLEVVEFVLGPERYGIESCHIREIHPLSEFTPLPCTPAFVLGLVNVRGQILSIIDIKKLFDLPARGLTDLNKVIIVHAEHMELGILADAILGVRRIESEELHPALPTMTGMQEEYLKGITKDPLVVLNVEKILSDEKILVNDAADARTRAPRLFRGEPQ